MTDALQLAQRLIRVDTSNGGEREAAEICRDILDRVGARTELVEMAPDRAHLLAHIGDTSRSPLVLSGHLDTVPANRSTWNTDPLSGGVRDGELLGRGSADMKGGVAALITAMTRHVTAGDASRGVLLVLTAAEETGCEGARHLVKTRELPTGGPLLVAEPTNLEIAPGHKGVLWLRASTTGRAAHGSRPDLGRSAIVPLARLVAALDKHGLPGEHPIMGPVTVNVGTFHGGTRINLVPEAASIEIDIRVVAGIDPRTLYDGVAALASPEVVIETTYELAPTYSAPGGPFGKLVATSLEDTVGSSTLRPPLAYFTDASVLSQSLGCSEVIVLGPGDPDAAHTTDERCPVAQIESAALVYERVLRAWAATGC